MINLGTLVIGELGGQAPPRPTRPPVAGSQGRGRAAGAGPELARLIEETLTVSRCLRAVLDEWHGGEAPSGGRRELLKDLARLGPGTVPQLARERAVTRQHIQALVDPLVEDGYVERLDNPAHRRSPLLCLSSRGREYVAAMVRRERDALSALEIAAGRTQLRRAAEVLRLVREAVESR
ncbi:MAG: MarR family winged helix-turn-helix transcriptional regulator [Gemmatimonadales bacterium]|jgi:DNA-binding MarR family transcriptional regulator